MYNAYAHVMTEQPFIVFFWILFVLIWDVAAHQ